MFRNRSSLLLFHHSPSPSLFRHTCILLVNNNGFNNNNYKHEPSSSPPEKLKQGHIFVLNHHDWQDAEEFKKIIIANRKCSVLEIVLPENTTPNFRRLPNQKCDSFRPIQLLTPKTRVPTAVSNVIQKKLNVNWSLLNKLQHLKSIKISRGGKTSGLNSSRDYSDIANNISSRHFRSFFLNHPSSLVDDNVLLDFLKIPSRVSSSSSSSITSLGIQSAQGLTPKSIDHIVQYAKGLHRLTLIDNTYISKNNEYDIFDISQQNLKRSGLGGSGDNIITTTSSSTHRSKIAVDDSVARKIGDGLIELTSFFYSSRSPICRTLQPFSTMEKLRELTVFAPLLYVSDGLVPPNLTSFGAADSRSVPDYEHMASTMPNLEKLVLSGYRYDPRDLDSSSSSSDASVGSKNNNSNDRTSSSSSSLLNYEVDFDETNNNSTANSSEDITTPISSSSLVDDEAVDPRLAIQTDVNNLYSTFERLGPVFARLNAFPKLKSFVLINFEGNMSASLKDWFSNSDNNSEHFAKNLQKLFISSSCSLETKDLLLASRSFPELSNLSMHCLKKSYFSYDDSHLTKIASRLPKLKTLNIFGAGTMTEDGLKMSVGQLPDLEALTLTGMLLRKETVRMNTLKQIDPQYERRAQKERALRRKQERLEEEEGREMTDTNPSSSSSSDKKKLAKFMKCSEKQVDSVLSSSSNESSSPPDTSSSSSSRKKRKIFTYNKYGLTIAIETVTCMSIVKAEKGVVKFLDENENEKENNDDVLTDSDNNNKQENSEELKKVQI